MARERKRPPTAAVRIPASVVTAEIKGTFWTCGASRDLTSYRSDLRDLLVLGGVPFPAGLEGA